MRISDWSSDVCSSDLLRADGGGAILQDTAKDIDGAGAGGNRVIDEIRHRNTPVGEAPVAVGKRRDCGGVARVTRERRAPVELLLGVDEHSEAGAEIVGPRDARVRAGESEEHTAELQSQMHISHALFCLK